MVMEDREGILELRERLLQDVVVLPLREQVCVPPPKLEPLVDQEDAEARESQSGGGADRMQLLRERLRLRKQPDGGGEREEDPDGIRQRGRSTREPRPDPPSAIEEPEVQEREESEQREREERLVEDDAGHECREEERADRAARELPSEKRHPEK